jgi:hypothetical protein
LHNATHTHSSSKTTTTSTTHTHTFFFSFKCKAHSEKLFRRVCRRRASERAPVVSKRRRRRRRALSLSLKTKRAPALLAPLQKKHTDSLLPTPRLTPLRRRRPGDDFQIDRNPFFF